MMLKVVLFFLFPAYKCAVLAKADRKQDIITKHMQNAAHTSLIASGRVLKIKCPRSYVKKIVRDLMAKEK